VETTITSVFSFHVLLRFARLLEVDFMFSVPPVARWLTLGVVAYICADVLALNELLVPTHETDDLMKRTRHYSAIQPSCSPYTELSGQ
jgi:hypothetical protein